MEENGGFLGFIKMHPELMLGFGVVAVLIVISMVKKQGSTASSSPQDLSGLSKNSQGQPVVYVPTSTNFTTENVGAVFSNDPSLNSVTTGAITTNSTISGNKSVAPVPVTLAKPVVNNTSPSSVSTSNTSTSTNANSTGGTQTGGVTPVKSPPVTPPPSKGIKWNYPYTVKSGDTLSGIANNVSNAARSAGAPSNTTITYMQIYNYNKSTIDSTSNAHGNPIPGGPWNNIFPGETIWLPTWS